MVMGMMMLVCVFADRTRQRHNKQCTQGLLCSFKNFCIKTNAENIYVYLPCILYNDKNESQLNRINISNWTVIALLAPSPDHCLHHCYCKICYCTLHTMYFVCTLKYKLICFLVFLLKDFQRMSLVCCLGGLRLSQPSRNGFLLLLLDVQRKELTKL